MIRYARGSALLFVAASAVFASAQRPTVRPAPAVAGPLAGPWANKFFLPGIEKDPGQVSPPAIVHDFGTVPHGTLCTQKFTVTNIYDVPIQVTDIRVEFRRCFCGHGVLVKVKRRQRCVAPHFIDGRREPQLNKRGPQRLSPREVVALIQVGRNGVGERGHRRRKCHRQCNGGSLSTDLAAT